MSRISISLDFFFYFVISILIEFVCCIEFNVPSCFDSSSNKTYLNENTSFLLAYFKIENVTFSQYF